MRVLFDHQVFDSQVVEGPSRYFYELARQLIARGVGVEFAVHETDNVFLHNDKRWANQVVHRQPARPWRARLRQLGAQWGVIPYMAVYQANQRASEAALARGTFDIFHPTYYEPYFLKHLHGKPYVVTVHDMIHELFPEYVKKGNPTTGWKKAVIKHAAHLIAVSECTKQDLIRLFAVSPERITVIHHGVGAPFTDQPVVSRTPSPYLLYVGSRDRYKNFVCLLEALPPIIRRYPEVVCICAGGGEFTETEKKQMQHHGITTHLKQVNVSDKALADLYYQATAFVFPSLYEGFGMPILEAFAAGCPIILSRASAFPEVARQAALYFDPHAPATLTAVIHELLDSLELQARLRLEGQKRAKLFTWEQTAELTKAVYEQCLV